MGNSIFNQRVYVTKDLAFSVTFERKCNVEAKNNAYLVHVGDGAFSCALGQGLVGKSRLGVLSNMVCCSSAENNDVQERVGTKPVSSVH